MKVHSITCIADNFTDAEIKAAEDFVIGKIAPVTSTFKRQRGLIVLLIQHDKIVYKVHDLAPIFKLRIENILRDK